MHSTDSPLDPSLVDRSYLKDSTNIPSAAASQGKNKKSKDSRRDSTTATKEKAQYSDTVESSNATNIESSSELYPKISPSAPSIEDITSSEDFGTNTVESQFLPEEKSNKTANTPPINPSTGKLELSKYRSPELLTSIDHITSIPYQIKSLLWPSIKIGAKALMTREDLSLKSLFADLNPHLTSEERENVLAAEKAKKAARSARSWSTQIIYFLLVGIPSAILVGLVYGLLTFFSNLLQDIYTIGNSSLRLLNEARHDVQYFKQNPEHMPDKDQAVNAITDQVAMPYARSMLQKKLGRVAFLAKPADFLLNRVIKTAALNSAKLITWVAGIPQVRNMASQMKNVAAEAGAKAGKKKREL